MRRPAPLSSTASRERQVLQDRDVGLEVAFRHLDLAAEGLAVERVEVDGLGERIGIAVELLAAPFHTAGQLHGTRRQVEQVALGVRRHHVLANRGGLEARSASRTPSRRPRTDRDRTRLNGAQFGSSLVVIASALMRQTICPAPFVTASMALRMREMEMLLLTSRRTSFRPYW